MPATASRLNKFTEPVIREMTRVAAVPGSSFFREPVNHFIRLNFAKKDKTLIEVGERLLRLKDI